MYEQRNKGNEIYGGELQANVCKSIKGRADIMGRRWAEWKAGVCHAETYVGFQES